MHNERRLSWPEKVRLATRIWLLFAIVTVQLRRRQLPDLVAELASPNGVPRDPRRPPATLNKAVFRSLSIGSHRPRCLINALVLFRLLREQGDAAELVIGLPEAAPDQRAHAWVELDGRDVGPPPGRGDNRELARLP